MPVPTLGGGVLGAAGVVVVVVGVVIEPAVTVEFVNLGVWVVGDPATGNIEWKVTIDEGPKQTEISTPSGQHPPSVQ